MPGQVMASATSPGPMTGAGCLQPGRRGHAGGHLHEDVDGLAGRLVHHQAHAAQAENVGDLVRVDEHAGGAVRQHGADELGHRQHARFDVHVRVQQPGHQISPAGLDDLGVRADGVAGILANVSDRGRSIRRYRCAG